ncbi:MAG: polyhydroxyalkanoate synthesis repressor PhaR [Erythrobacter sp.]|uniref:polyhydroxyalkanoate synthesis repressor PhaR n=1 Tax=Erythrobacter sp. TaxID=1042 RepID=UPI003C7394C4
MTGKSKNTGAADDPVVIKKYANRRLYNTASSSYITLDDLAAMVRADIEFAVFDAKSGEDITHSILTQIIVDEEANGQHMLPVSFLRQLIGMYGNSMQGVMPSYLEASMKNFQQNQAKIREAFDAGMSNNPLAAIHETNMAMMRAAAQSFMPAGSKRKMAGSGGGKGSGESSTDEIAALREQMAAMQQKLDKLDK